MRLLVTHCPGCGKDLRGSLYHDCPVTHEQYVVRRAFPGRDEVRMTSVRKALTPEQFAAWADTVGCIEMPQDWYARGCPVLAYEDESDER